MNLGTLIVLNVAAFFALVPIAKIERLIFAGSPVFFMFAAQHRIAAFRALAAIPDNFCFHAVPINIKKAQYALNYLNLSELSHNLSSSVMTLVNPFGVEAKDMISWAKASAFFPRSCPRLHQ